MNTKQKIIMEASREFAEKGFAGARIRNICRNAKVNLASVNYHFSSKKSLYKAVFAFLMSPNDKYYKFPDSSQKFNIRIWKEELREWIKHILHDITCDDSVHRFKRIILGRELLAPSGIFQNIFDTYMKTKLDSLVKQMRKALPSGISDDAIYVEAFSVVSECVFYLHYKAIVNAKFPNRDFTLENFNEIVEHATNKTYMWISHKRRKMK